MVLKILKTSLISLGFLVFFLILTFPFGRLAPKISFQLERALAGLGFQTSCSIEGLELQLPLGFGWSKLGCYQGVQPVLELTSGDLSILPKRQHLEAQIGKGTIDLKTNANIKSPINHISANLQNIAVEKITPLIVGIIGSRNPRIMIPKTLKLEGLLLGSIDLPLQNFEKKSGKIDIQINNLKIPQQSFSDLFGLKDLVFTKAVVKGEIKSGKLTIQDFALLSPQVSLKVEGGLDLQDDIMKSMGPITLKWKIEKSDALLSAPLGSAIATAPCPSQDTEGFCTKRYQRLNEMFVGL